MYKKEFTVEIPIVDWLWTFAFVIDKSQFNLGGTVGGFSQKCEQCGDHDVYTFGVDLFLGFLIFSTYIE